jgi:hypothetical protein
MRRPVLRHHLTFFRYKKGRHSAFSKQPKPNKMNFLFTLLLLGCTVQSLAHAKEETTHGAFLYRRSPSRRTHDEGSGAAPPPPLPHRFTIPSMLTSDGPTHDEDSGADPQPPLPHRFTIPSMLNSDEPSATADLPLPPLFTDVRPGAVYVASHGLPVFCLPSQTTISQTLMSKADLLSLMMPLLYLKLYTTQLFLQRRTY